ncbi:MFS transporter [Streptomyces sp. RerS4]|uniref:MFS transporter n=1 Tax=Streptomyces sp. RerS4 TaxID=2942449 RepID=UPI00201BDE45|nr:MFS transporter [Streptomyces sp. RerS4]UQX04389.1 MFS transporter [Streptomyces sp. RerS4]
MTPPAPPRARPRRALLAGAAGNFVEWYEFGVYGCFATVIAAHFFTPASTGGGGSGGSGGAGPLIATYASFAVAFFFRPAGALLFGRLGDRAGRRPTLILVIGLMTLATTLIGLLPTRATAGVAAPVLLTVLRALQGLSAGGEFGGAVALMTESAPPGRRGRYGAWQSLTVALGLLAGAATAALLATVLTPAALHAWGWRIPFLLALPLGLTALHLRTTLPPEPPPPVPPSPHVLCALPEPPAPPAPGRGEPPASPDRSASLDSRALPGLPEPPGPSVSAWAAGHARGDAPVLPVPPERPESGHTPALSAFPEPPSPPRSPASAGLPEEGVPALPVPRSGGPDRAGTPPRGVGVRAVLLGVGRVMGWSAAGYTFLVVLPSYLQQTLGASFREALIAAALANLGFAAAILPAGMLSDRIGRRPVMLCGALTVTLLALPLLHLLQDPAASAPAKAAAVLGAGAVVGLLAGPGPAMLAEMFPAQVRCTGLALAYALANAVFSGCAGLIITALTAATGDTDVPALYAAGACAASALALASLRGDDHKRPLR